MLIDTHSHLNFEDFKSDWKKVADNCLKENIWIINAGANYETSKKAVEIAENYKEGVYAAIGLHPIHAKENFDKKKYLELALSRVEGSKKVVAIGEIGLDRYKNYGDFIERQKEIFLEQLSLAKELNLPAIIHCRKAHQEIIDILKTEIQNSKLQIPNKLQFPKSKILNRGVIHCFTGTWEEAEEYLNLGFYLGFNGIIFKFDLKEVIERTPLNRILVETDCPYLAPPMAGVERNEPIFVKYVIEEISKIKNISFEEVAEATTKNAKTLFKI